MCTWVPRSCASKEAPEMYCFSIGFRVWGLGSQAAREGQPREMLDVLCIWQGRARPREFNAMRAKAQQLEDYGFFSELESRISGV